VQGCSLLHFFFYYYSFEQKEQSIDTWGGTLLHLTKQSCFFVAAVATYGYNYKEGEKKRRNKMTDEKEQRDGNVVAMLAPTVGKARTKSMKCRAIIKQPCVVCVG
jgi:hypothetical protein